MPQVNHVTPGLIDVKFAIKSVVFRNHFFHLLQKIHALVWAKKWPKWHEIQDFDWVIVENTKNYKQYILIALHHKSFRLAWSWRVEALISSCSRVVLKSEKFLIVMSCTRLCFHSIVYALGLPSSHNSAILPRELEPYNPKNYVA